MMSPMSVSPLHRVWGYRDYRAEGTMSRIGRLGISRPAYVELQETAPGQTQILKAKTQGRCWRSPSSRHRRGQGPATSSKRCAQRSGSNKLYVARSYPRLSAITATTCILRAQDYRDPCALFAMTLPLQTCKSGHTRVNSFTAFGLLAIS